MGYNAKGTKKAGEEPHEKARQRRGKSKANPNRQTEQPTCYLEGRDTDQATQSLSTQESNISTSDLAGQCLKLDAGKATDSGEGNEDRNKEAEGQDADEHKQ